MFRIFFIASCRLQTSNLDFFISLSCLIAVTRTYSTMLNKNCESHLCLIPDVRGNAFSFSLLNMMLSVLKPITKSWISPLLPSSTCVHNLNLIMRKHQTDQNWKTFYKLTNQDSTTVFQGHKRQRKMEKLSQIGED